MKMERRLLLLAAVITGVVRGHPSLHENDTMMGASPSFWDRMDPHELLGEHQHAAGISGNDELDELDVANNISVVHVVQSCHLDIGFTSTMADVINLYFHTHIPAAIATGQKMRSGNNTWVPLTGAYVHGNDRPGWPRNTTVAVARDACALDDECVGFAFHNTANATKRIYLKGKGATTNTDKTWTHYERPLPKPPPGWRLRFTMQSWYLLMYLNCPEPNSLGLHCPSAADKAALKAAITVGDITWHAFPHNAELEAASADVIRAALDASHALDAELGVAPKIVLSQRDVPGVTRAMIPLLKAAGVQAVSVGVNGASMYPRVPRIFRWQDPISREEVLAMWHARGYGGYSKAEAVVVPGFDQILVTDWNGDNRGVRSEREYLDHLHAIQNEWPNATVVVSTFDNFTSQLLKSGMAKNLPRVTQEIGDSWIYGDPSDARKLAMMRALHRAWGSSSASASSAEKTAGSRHLSSSSSSSSSLANATRFMLKNMEHTWGEHEHGLNYLKANWTNRGFRHARNVTPFGYERLESTWWEQRAFGMNATVEALKVASHPLQKVVEKELGEYKAACEADYTRAGADPAKLGWTMVPSAKVAATFLTLGDVRVGFNDQTGEVTTLDKGGMAWASADRRLFGLAYVTYSPTNFTCFQKAYSGLDHPPSWFGHDFGKPGDLLANYTLSHGVLQRMWTRANSGGSSSSGGGSTSPTEALLLLALDDADAAIEYGGAQRYFLRVSLQSAAEKGEEAAAVAGTMVRATFHAVEKTPTRHAEALFLRFNPPQAKGAESQKSVELDKLGQWLPATRDLVVDGGSKLLHGVQSGVRVRSLGRGDGPSPQPPQAMSIGMPDTGVVSLGAPNGFPIVLNTTQPWQPPDVETHGFSSMLFNNLWGTNYVMWQPYRRNGSDVPAEASYAFRYEITWAAAAPCEKN